MPRGTMCWSLEWCPDPARASLLLCGTTDGLVGELDFALRCASPCPGCSPTRAVLACVTLSVFLPSAISVVLGREMYPLFETKPHGRSENIDHAEMVMLFVILLLREGRGEGREGRREVAIMSSVSFVRRLPLAFASFAPARRGRRLRHHPWAPGPNLPTAAIPLADRRDPPPRTLRAASAHRRLPPAPRHLSRGPSYPSTRHRVHSGRREGAHTAGNRMHTLGGAASGAATDRRSAGGD